MVIADAIREAETEYVVYFLLDAYLNSNSRRVALSELPAPISVLPLRGKNDAQARFILLKAEFDAAMKRQPDDAAKNVGATCKSASGESHSALPTSAAE